MNLKNIHFSIYEFALLNSRGVTVEDSYDAILAAHASEPEVVSLFEDLKKEWATRTADDQYPMSKTFQTRGSEDADFAVAAFFAEAGSFTTNISGAWSDMAIAFLLEKKLQTEDPTSVDIAVAQHLLQWDADQTTLDPLFLSWSSNTSWHTITQRTNTELPEEWWSTFTHIQPQTTSMPTLPLVEKAALESGASLEHVKAVNEKWRQYVGAYEGLG